MKTITGRNNPDIVCINGIDNILAETISRIDNDPDVNARHSCLSTHWLPHYVLVKYLQTINQEDYQNGTKSFLGVYMDMRASDFNLGKFDLNHIFAIEKEDPTRNEIVEDQHWSNLIL